MTEIAVPWRVFVGGCAAAAIGVTVFAGGIASADPVAPTPPPAPAGAVQTPQNFVAAPGGAAGRRFVPTPPSANPFAPPSLAVAPGAAAVAPTPPAANPFAPPTLAAAPAAAGAPAQPAPTPAASGTLRDYFQSKGVKLEAQKPQGFKALDITLPVPARWTQVPDPNVPDAFAVIADRQGASVYTSNAQVVVYKLVGNFDPREAITHGYVDSQKLLAWQPTNASMADFAGFPSSVVEGTYREGDMTLNTSRRHVIASSGHDKYLVSLSVTTDRAVAVSDAPATNAIINGFRVTAPGAPAAPAPSTAPVGLPGQTPAAAPAPVRAPAVIPAQPPAAAAALPAPAAAPAPAAVPSQLQAAQPAPNLLALVPGLPPLPNFTSITGR
ncbi:LpqN/LpqT family lipoprotein [Mycobacterium shigaense]|uniref:Proline-rich 28 kDa antigen homolog n=1 Tax=Mycobacterium shigaense TaxID=722731 RepID=A0A1Z4EB90_9MYCO|nr:LpqN/LpqT family lipoprotein [Mycobacterium shigaense]PRI15260.1 hypothetical protein B2J96_12705 [Mycobacterium shigaense]BAX90221.1 proline-rich 28 kDa antigen homolog [Mycobacterium shigaense]